MRDAAAVAFPLLIIAAGTAHTLLDKSENRSPVTNLSLTFGMAGLAWAGRKRDRQYSIDVMALQPLPEVKKKERKQRLVPSLGLSKKAA